MHIPLSTEEGGREGGGHISTWGGCVTYDVLFVPEQTGKQRLPLSRKGENKTDKVLNQDNTSTWKCVTFSLGHVTIHHCHFNTVMLRMHMKFFPSKFLPTHCGSKLYCSVVNLQYFILDFGQTAAQNIYCSFQVTFPLTGYFTGMH